MKAVLLSIRPEWCQKIFGGEKTIEVRKTVPNLETPFTVYVYQTKIKFKVKNWQENFQSIVFTPNGGVEEGNGKVIGSFVCDRVFELQISGDDCGNYWHEWDDEGDIQDMCLSYEELETYLGKSVGYGWHISDLKIYDKPRELSEFYRSLPEKVLENGEYDCRKPWDALCIDAPEGGDYCAECPYGGRVQITRAPQSWCYVEEI